MPVLFFPFFIENKILTRFLLKMEKREPALFLPIFKNLLESLYIMLYNLRKKGERTLIFYPDAYFKNAKQITTEFLNKNNIKALILDLDNTLIDYDRNMPEGTIEWANELKKNGIKLYIVTNTNKKKKAESVSKKLDIEYNYFATKPLKFGLLKAQKKLKEKPENIAVVGDQLFTDVLGANRCKMFSILVDPIAERDILITKVKRPIENFLKKKYFEKLNKGGVMDKK